MYCTTATRCRLTNISYQDFGLDHLEKTVGSCKYGNEQTDYMERGLLDNTLLLKEHGNITLSVCLSCLFKFCVDCSI
jgi:hypothetical protein